MIINNILLKSLIFEIGQINWNGWSCIDEVLSVCPYKMQKSDSGCS